MIGALTPVPSLSRFFFGRQDCWVLLGLIGLLCGSAAGLGVRLPRLVVAVKLDRTRVLLMAAALAIVLWGGTYAVLDNYPLTRDEHMVLFDMEVFRSGRLASPVPLAWRPYVQALSPAFLLPLNGDAAWVSVYMPVNAMMRTAFGAVLDPALMNPVLVAAGAVALFDIARRLFPRNPGAQAVALLLYGTSAQVLVTAMTGYAMTAHLSLNLIWLAFFLRGGRAGHAGAMLIGFLAIGLHQIVFHPLFALPFMEDLRRRREWRTTLGYVLSYAVFGLFWISYPHLVSASAGLSAGAGSAAGSSGFVSERVLPLLLDRSPLTIPLTVVNLARFVAWQNLALLPLMALAFGAINRGEGIARPLAQGVLLTTVAMMILLPYQGHGWGYRYLHGLIGNCALLGAYAWRDFSDRYEVRSLVGLGTLLTLFGSLPFLLWQAHAFVEPYARVNRAIDRIDADMVVIQSEGTEFWVDEVRNRPDLTNRPLRFASERLTLNDIRTLCGRGTVAFVDTSKLQGPGIGSGEVADPQYFDRLRASAPNGCAPRRALR